MRNFLALVLILIGAALTFPAAVAYWERNELIDEQRFVDVGNDVLERDEVQAAIARKLSDEVRSETNAPSIATDPIASRVVRGLPNSTASDDALRLAYGALLAIVRGEGLQAEGDRIVLDLGSVAEEIRRGLSIGGDVVIPEGAGQIEIVESGELTDALRVVRWFDDVAMYIALLPVAFFALALLVASSRPFALVLVGGAVLLTSLLRIVIVQSALSKLLTDAVVSDNTTRDAANAAYDVISATFLRLDVILLAVGVALIVVGVVLGVLRRVVSPLG